MNKKKLESIVEDLFYQMSTGILYDVEYKERQIDLEKKLEQLACAKGIDSQFEAFLRGLLGDSENMKDSYMARNVKQDKLMIEIVNAIDEREMHAIKIACKTGILYGINLCKSRGKNIQG